MKLKKPVKKVRRPKTNIDTVRRVFAGIDSENKWWKPKVGDNVIRILPSNREDGNFAYHSIQHHGFKVDGQARAFPCMGAFGKPCPVCKVISYYDTETDPDIKDVLNNISPRHAYLMNIIDRKNTEKVQIFSAAKTVMREIMQYMNDEEYGDITDPEEGRDVKINRVGEGLATKYSTRVSPKTSHVNMDGWEDLMFNLEAEAYREIPTYKKYTRYLIANFQETLDIPSALDIETEEEDEEEESPKKKRKVKSSKASSRAKKIEEDEEDDDEDELDEDDL